MGKRRTKQNKLANTAVIKLENHLLSPSEESRIGYYIMRTWKIEINGNNLFFNGVKLSDEIAQLIREYFRIDEDPIE